MIIFNLNKFLNYKLTKNFQFIWFELKSKRLEWVHTVPILQQKSKLKPFRQISVIVVLYLEHQHCQRYQWQNRKPKRPNQPYNQRPNEQSLCLVFEREKKNKLLSWLLLINWNEYAKLTGIMCNRILHQSVYLWWVFPRLNHKWQQYRP